MDRDWQQTNDDNKHLEFNTYKQTHIHISIYMHKHIRAFLIHTHTNTDTQARIFHAILHADAPRTSKRVAIHATTSPYEDFPIYFGVPNVCINERMNDLSCALSLWMLMYILREQGTSFGVAVLQCYHVEQYHEANRVKALYQLVWRAT